MAGRIDVEQARAWLAGIPGNFNDLYEARWRQFSEHGDPVVTLYGAYDTGKSSLIRRLIVDFDQLVPEWLTISARHETFEVNEVVVAGCTLRDTPGFVSIAADLRADVNTGLAAEAIALTDVGIIVLTPQLATAEYEMLAKLVRSGWPSGSLWFVISRFDEAGIDPESDPAGYRQLADRKTSELRLALNLDQTVPVHVVCQDLAQMAGSERNPGRGFWDESRPWDGMQRLESAISELGKSSFATLRDAAGQRFWRDAVESVSTQLDIEVSEYETRKVLCDQGLELRNSWMAQVQDLRLAAEADLRGRVAEITGEAVYDAAAVRVIGGSLTAVLDSWYIDQERKVDKLLQSFLATTSVERSRPSWKQLDDFAKSVRGQQTKVPRTNPHEELFTPAAEKVAKAVLAAFIDYQKIGKTTSGTAASKGESRDILSSNVAAAGATVVVEVVRIAEKLYQQKAMVEEQHRERARLESELNRVGQQSATVALEALEPLLDEARSSITEATAEQVDMLEGLDRMLEELRKHLASANKLLGK